MTQYIVRGSTLFVSNERDSQVVPEIPVGNYIVSLDPFGNFYLSRTDEFTVPSKLYGDAEIMSDRFLTTFALRPNTTGVLLAGTQGSGKSLTMKLTSIKGAAIGLPTIIVNSNFCGDGFNKFIQTIDQPCILVFDEFEKVYNDVEQQSLLTLLDGLFSGKKLIMMTCNDKHKINQHMVNRPGRIFYNLTYRGLKEQFIREYCADNLKDQTKVDSIVTLAAMYVDFNFDVLQAIIEELNRYGEEVKEVVSILNVDPPMNSRVIYDLTLFKPDGVQVKKGDFYPEEWTNLMQAKELIIEEYLNVNEGSDEDDQKDHNFRMDAPNNRIRPDFSEVRLKNEEGYLLIAKKREYTVFDYRSLL